MLRFWVCLYGDASSAPLALAFDEALAALAALPRLFIEPDGSFVWTGTTPGGERWQVDGNLIDRGDVLAHVELKGCCPEEQFDELLVALGGPAATLAFQLPRQGVTLNEAAFRRVAVTPAGAV
jgi:hypothetical protein